jgi:conjugal transfer pilus assembly protein TraU
MVNFIKDTLKARCLLSLFFFLLLGLQTVEAKESLTCQGKFINPIEDICWSCLFPIKVASTITLMDEGQEDNKSLTGKSFCACENPARGGIALSFWEPSHLVEVVRTPFCMVSLGGVDLGAEANTGDVGNVGSGSSLTDLFGGHGSTQKTISNKESGSFRQVHWFKNPVMFWLEAVLDSECLERGTLDIGWLSEVDPTWKFPELAFLQAPESALFANVIAQSACAADCIQAGFGFPSNILFWCAGCQGSIYPYSGWSANGAGPIVDSKLLAARMQAKMHRDLIAWDADGEEALCSYRLAPMMDKRSYKMGMTYPVAARKFNGKCCDPIGRSTLVRDNFKTYPYKGADFAYQIFRKRDCCSAFW